MQRVLPALRRALLTWYRSNARDLPWRRSRDPYAIWLSEIMLQQTQVATVEPYYERFLAAFPDVDALAAAPLLSVLKLWEGLGYYSRARNLHRAARLITEGVSPADRMAPPAGVAPAISRCPGVARTISPCEPASRPIRSAPNLPDPRFPRTAADWQALPGIGRYTAAAIASIAFDQPVASLDGNVHRVLARLFAVDEPIEQRAVLARLWQHAEDLLDRRNPGDFNQAMMELGARVCTRRSPDCGACPLSPYCAARATGRPDKLPPPRNRRPPRRVESLAALLTHRGRILLVQRPARGLLGGMWALPACPAIEGQRHTAVLAEHLADKFELRVAIGPQRATITHQFTHRLTTLHVFEGRVLGGQVGVTRHAAAEWVARRDLHLLPLARLDQKALAAALPKVQAARNAKRQRAPG